MAGAFPMSLPKLSDQQIARAIQQVATYIEQQRQIYRGVAAPLDGEHTRAMQPFFSASALDSTRAIVLSGQRASNPPFYVEFIKMGFEAGSLPDFALMKAITLLDTVISHEPLTDRLLFHELVHVVQYQKLGVADFATKYVTGFLRGGGSYESIPLEMNAYELDARFASAPAKTFSVEAEVETWIRTNRF
jgi:hypothetical protein